ncbi:coiled-coil domain-containing protein 183-like [Melopsittacus undulatus]|uniref:coiled-coil domain-containing protein 183-like n=1 Tax=Melopsittacus undulatus TaxID=13146 RepID=UPI00146ED0CB|nr:coiled-coil domain-containing protein 183-like [Melopsittacus undulatus]
MLGQKTSLSKRIPELRASIALQGAAPLALMMDWARWGLLVPASPCMVPTAPQCPAGQARKFYTKAQEEKFNQKRELLPRLREAVQEDIHVLGLVRKHELTLSEACGAEQPLGRALGRKTLEVAQEKLQAEIYGQVNRCNLLLEQVKQRSQAREQLQRRLQQLQQDAQMEERQHQAQAQVVRTLQNGIAKMQTKVRAGQKVTALYVVLRDALRKELAHLPLHLDLLSQTAELQHGEVEDMELMASHGRRAARVAKEHVARMKTQLLAERELRLRTLAAHKVPPDRGWLKEPRERLLKARARQDLARDLRSQPAQDPLVGAKAEASKSRLQREASVMEQMEKAKAALQCSCLWDIPCRLLAQHKSQVELEQYLTGRKEKQQQLQKALEELQLKLQELKFRQPPDPTRGLEEELRTRLQWEEARLEQRRAQLLRSQETLLELETGLDNLWVRLRGIPVPGQEHPVKAMAADEKLQQCEQKLQYLVQRVADLPPPSQDQETLGKVRELLEKTLGNDPGNQKVSLEDMALRVQDDLDFDDSHSGLVLTREDIKKEGLRLSQSKKKSKRR